MRAGGVLVVLVGLAGCEAPDVEHIPYRLRVLRQDTLLGRPPPAVPATVYIDGIARESLELTFETDEVYLAAEIAVELRHGDLVLDTLVAGGRSCSSGGTIESASETVAMFDHGELALWSYDVDGSDSCIVDVWDWPRCATPCGAGEHCTSVMTSLDPLFSRLACAPAGPRTLGETCAWQPGTDGYVHDCGADLLCVDGICRAVCTDGACTGCAFVEGHARQLRVCP